MRKIVCCDLDGVVVGGDFIPREQRCPDRYIKLPLLDEDAPSIINYWADRVDWYFLSARSYENSTISSRYWLRNHGVDLSKIAGVICNISPYNKGQLLYVMGAHLHIDDDERVISSIDREEGTMGLHFQPPKVGWQEVAALLDTLVFSKKGLTL